MIGRVSKRLSYYLTAAKEVWQQRTTPIIVPTEPHFDAATQAFFHERLARSTSYLEFGSGGSTLLAARLGINTLSVESSARYAAAVSTALGATTTVDFHYANIGWTRHWGHPVANNPTAARTALWYTYIDVALKALDGQVFPDLVLIDGRFRRACALHVAHYAATHGYATEILFDDYAARESYHAVEAWLGTPERIGRSALFRVGADRTLPIPETVLQAALADPD